MPHSGNHHIDVDRIPKEIGNSFILALPILYSAFFGLSFYYGADLVSKFFLFVKNQQTLFIPINILFQEISFIKLLIFFLLSAYILEDFIMVLVVNSKFPYKTYRRRFVLDMYIAGMSVLSIILLFHDHRSFILFFAIHHLFAYIWTFFLYKEHSLSGGYCRSTMISHLLGFSSFFFLFLYSTLLSIKCGAFLYSRFILLILAWYLLALICRKISKSDISIDIREFQHLIIGNAIKQILRPARFVVCRVADFIR